MTIDDTDAGQEGDFATFEAQAMSDEPPPPADDDDAGKGDDDDPPEDDDEGQDDGADDEGGDDDAPPEEGKKRSKPAKQRIDELTAARRAAERERDELKQRLEALEGKADAPKADDELKAPDPDDDKYEFGAADPQYIADLVEFKAEQKAAEKDKAKAEETRRTAAVEAANKLDEQWTEMQARGAERHEDFAEKVGALQVTEPILALAIQSSPVGDEAAYHLANNPHEADLLQARIASGDIIGAAEKFGEIDGAFLDEKPERPTNGNPLDIALYAGRLKAWTAKGAKPKGKIATDAPDPPKERARGAGGKFATDPATTDFAAFEARAKAEAAKRG